MVPSCANVSRGKLRFPEGLSHFTFQSLGVVVEQHCLEYLTCGDIYSCGIVPRVLLWVHADNFSVPLYSY